MSEHKPEAVWVFPDEPRKRGGRIALIVGLTVAVLVAAAIVVLFLIPRGDGSPSPTHSPTSTATPTPSSSPTPTTSPTPSPTVVPSTEPTTPQTSPPPAPDPSVAEFRGHVQPRLDAAARGLGLAQGQSGDTAVQIVDSLQNDAQNLAGQSAPASIAVQWGEDVNTYSAKLQALRSAYAGGSDASGPLADARAVLEQLRGLVGL